MKPFIKYPGGKTQQLPKIRELMPHFSGRFIEPFVGGGAVYFDTEADSYCINDLSTLLILLYIAIKIQSPEFFMLLSNLCIDFSCIGWLVKLYKSDVLDLYTSTITVDAFINMHIDIFTSIAYECNDIFLIELDKILKNKIANLSKISAKNGSITDNFKISIIETAIKSAYYNTVRYMFNHCTDYSQGQQAAIFFIIRQLCFSSMFRFNNKGDFNVPYGGMSYNNVDMMEKIKYLSSQELVRKLQKTRIYNEDFESFMNALNITSDDFIYLDPPYLCEFSTYDKNNFGIKEHVRLHDYLTNTHAKFILTVNNADLIYDLYDDFNIVVVDDKFSVNMKNRNNRDISHLIITNY